MLVVADIRRYINEAQTCIESAIAAGEIVAGHGIVPSRDFEKLMENLRLALEALDQAKLPDNVVRLPIPARM
jgi:hypothetical protein